jgi:hypothetical protein
MTKLEELKAAALAAYEDAEAADAFADAADADAADAWGAANAAADAYIAELKKQEENSDDH